MPEGWPKARKLGWTCPLRRLSGISGFMRPITRPGACHESRGPFYARGLSRSKRKRSTRSDRSFAHPSAAPLEAGVALGRDHRGDDAALAPARQKRRGRAGLALGCLFIRALGGADADQGFRLAPEGRLLGRERRGAGIHWASARCQGTDSRPLQHRPGLCGARQGGDRRSQPLGGQGGTSLWLCRRGESVGRYHGPGTPDWLSQRTRDLAGARPALRAGLDAVAQAGCAGTQWRSGAGADHLALGQRTPSVYVGPSGQAPGVDSNIDRGWGVDGANAPAYRASQYAIGPGDAERPLTAHGNARGGQAADETDRPLALDGASSPEQNGACGHPASPRHRAEQGGQENGIWLGLSDWSSGRGLSVWKADRGQCGRKADAAPGVGRVPGDLWPDGDAGVGGLRPRWRFDPYPPPARVGRCQGGGDSAQRASAVVGCRGSPGADSQRAGSDRGQHWDIEKQPVQIQQTQGTSLANAGDGGSAVYLVLQSEQIHEGFGRAHLVRERNKRLDRSPDRRRIQRW